MAVVIDGTEEPADFPEAHGEIIPIGIPTEVGEVDRDRFGFGVRGGDGELGGAVVGDEFGEDAGWAVANEDIVGGGGVTAEIVMQVGVFGEAVGA